MNVKKKYVRCDPSGDAGPCFVYSFKTNGERVFGRRWRSDMNNAELLHWRDREKRFRKFHSIPYDHDTFREVVRYYVERERIHNIYVLLFQKKKRTSPEYCRVDLRKISRKKDV